MHGVVICGYGGGNEDEISRQIDTSSLLGEQDVCTVTGGKIL